MNQPWRNGGRARTTKVLLLASVLLAVMLVPVGTLGPLPAARVGGGSLHAPAAVSTNVVFAERAGFDPARDRAVPQPVPATGDREVVVTFQPRNASEFESPTPGAPPLNASGVADRFGVSPGDYRAAIAYFRAEGLSIVHSWSDRLALTLAGSVPSVERAFATSLLSGDYQGRSVTFPSTAPSLPAALESEVLSVVGLSSGFGVFSLPSGLAPSLRPLSGAAQGAGDLVTPAIARSIYQLSSLYNVSGTPQYASGQGIALLLWGPGYVPSDLATFFSRYYPASIFPAAQYTAVPVDGAPAPSASAANDPCGAAQELTLDLEWSGSMAPGAHLYAVYAPEGAAPACSPSSTAMADALHTAVGLPITALSMSFGTPESTDGSLAAAWDTYLSVGAQEGITMLAATGDTGGDLSAGCQGGPAPQYPSTSPQVLAVGGTDVTLLRNLLGQVTGFSESAWNLSGGGFSSQFAAPYWQHTGNSMRGTPDVSASAAADFLYFNGQSEVAAGTSFSTPIWAGLVTEMQALSAQSLAPLAPRLYTVAEEEAVGKIAPGLADVTSGATCLGSAGPGWDPETGWGSPRALLLFEDLTATFVALSVHFSPTAVAPGGSVTISGHLSNRSSGAAIAGVPIQITLSSSTNLGPCTGAFGSASPTTDSGGNVSIVLSVPACYLGASAEVRLLVASQGYYGTNSTTVPVNLLGWVPFLSGLDQYPYNVIGFSAIFVAASVVGYVLGRSRRRPPAIEAIGTGGSAAVPPGAERAYPPPGPPEASASGPPPAAGPGPRGTGASGVGGLPPPESS